MERMLRAAAFIATLTPAAVNAWVVWLTIKTPRAPEPTPLTPAKQTLKQAIEQKRDAERQQKEIRDLYLCRLATACKKYDQVRLECATANNSKNCIRIKMDENANFIGVCSGYSDGGPAVPLPADTPNALDCWFRTISK
jgi:hypothetical protein